MGLLDEAIREHLELKRRRGADPGEIARAEHEALEPIFPQESADPVEPALADDGYEPVFDDSQHGVPEADDGEHLAVAPEAPEFAGAAQETAELDMQAVLDADVERPSQPPPAADGIRPVRAPGAQAPREDSMDWEAQGRPERAPLPEQVPGQERLSFE